MISSMSHGNRWCRVSSKLSLSTRFVCARTSFSTNVTVWWSLFLLLEWIHPSIDQHTWRHWAHVRENRNSTDICLQTSSFL
jgi:hypothetical protein